jgi:hypothetical protein
MRIIRRKTERRRLSGTGMEMAGALMVASQVAYLSPPGFDEWVRLQMAGEPDPPRSSRSRRAGEQVLRALAIAAQMGLLFPAGTDESMRQELRGGDVEPRRDPRH